MPFTNETEEAGRARRSGVGPAGLQRRSGGRMTAMDELRALAENAGARRS